MHIWLKYWSDSFNVSRFTDFLELNRQGFFNHIIIVIIIIASAARLQQQRCVIQCDNTTGISERGRVVCVEHTRVDSYAGE